jgi:protein-L-isoaspartate O-methyltransferase
MTEAEWNGRRKWSDFPYIGTAEATATAGKHRYRQMPKEGGRMWERQQVFITDAKRVDPPAPADSKPAPLAPPEREPAMVGYAAPRPRDNDSPEDQAFRAMRDGLKNGGGVQVVTAPQLFPTPADLAARMVAIADIQDDDDVLEPSAGTGAILAIFARGGRGGNTVAVELNSQLAAILNETYQYVRVLCADFLAWGPEYGGPFDKVLMNPPFSCADDIKHILHAAKMLKPGGRIVAICANGPRQRDKLKPMASYWEDLPPDTFKESGTNVNAALLAIDNPATHAEGHAQ